MGITERRERERQQRRSDILDAAETVFFSRGFEDATMEEIAQEVELSKGTIYLYFKSKEDLYLGILQRALEKLQEIFQTAVSTEKTGLEKVKAIGEAYYQFSCDYPDYFNVMMHFDKAKIELTDKSSDECPHIDNNPILVVADAIRTGIEDGSIRPDLDPYKTAFLLWAQSNGVIQLIVVKGEMLKKHMDFNPQELIAESIKLTRQVLQPKGVDTKDQSNGGKI